MLWQVFTYFCQYFLNIVWIKDANHLGWGPYYFGGQSTVTFKVKFNFKSKFTPFSGSQNLDQMCKIPWLRSLWIWEELNFGLQDQIRLKNSNFLVSQLLEIHNHHITTREPWVHRMLRRPHWSPSSAYVYIPRLFNNPDCFTVSTLCTYTYPGSQGYFGV